MTAVHHARADLSPATDEVGNDFEEGDVDVDGALPRRIPQRRHAGGAARPSDARSRTARCGAGAAAVSAPIPCPQVQPLVPGEYPDAVRLVDGLVRAARVLPGARGDRLALVGHSRGGGAIQQYLLAGGHVQAAVLHSSGFALSPWTRAAEFTVPMLIMHGTADGPADGGGPNTRVELARKFAAALRAHKKSVESAYCDGCGHNTFFTNPSQRHEEVERMVAFLRRHLGS